MCTNEYSAEHNCSSTMYIYMYIEIWSLDLQYLLLDSLAKSYLANEQRS